MFLVKRGLVLEMIQESPGLQEVTVQVEGKTDRAVNYPDLTGPIREGDRVLLNTTACFLKLGTGGYHFVMGVENREEREFSGKGHIMKLRYTPWQIRVEAAEEESSPYHRQIKEFSSLENIPVIVGGLHSMIVPALLAYRTRRQSPVRAVYIMTDGAALPVQFSRVVRKLKDCGLLHTVITCGHAFGGDLETVNFYSALAAAKAAAGAEVVAAAMGPGIVGTHTKYGFSGIEQAYMLEAVERLGGKPVAVPRISFTDPRSRHRGLSHHSRTVLSDLTYARAYIGFPQWGDERDRILEEQIQAERLAEKHHLIFVRIPPVGELLRCWGLEVTTMGRSYEQDPSFFDTAAAAGVVAAGLAAGEI